MVRLFIVVQLAVLCRRTCFMVIDLWASHVANVPDPKRVLENLHTWTSPGQVVLGFVELREI